jgi:transcriptional regulator of acetoin/glycerol metabolism
MSCGARARPEVSDDSRLAQARERFLTSEPIEPGQVRDTIHPGDLPRECWSVSRRLLSPLESIERDAIVQCLLDHRGNKSKGAGSLGMSLATIYRKIHQYGIITPAS